MSVSSTYTNYNYASLDASRLASARAAEEAAEQVRSNIADQASRLEPGTTVTARYQYKVGADGTLVPTETQITTEANDADAVTRDGDNKQRSRQALTRQNEERQQSFGDIAKPRALLSPADELALFASIASESESASESSAINAPIAGEAVASDGSKVEVEIFTAGTPLAANQGSAQVLDLTARVKSSVAALYARNNDLVFSVNPAAQLAA